MPQGALAARQERSPLRSVANRDSFPLKVFAQAVVELGQSPQLQIGHRLLVLLNLRRVADIARGVLRHRVEAVGVGRVQW